MAQSAHNRYALGVDIGGSHVCSAVVDLATGQLCGEPHTDKVDAAAGARTIAGAWAANIRRTAAASGIGRIRCAGFAFPGPFDYERGISLIRGVRKFERIYGLDVAATLYPLLRECGTEEFRYVNDAAAFALGECLGGVADDAERVVALTLGTGVGSGFVAGRRLVTSGDEVPANGWVYCLPFEGGIVDEAFSTRWVFAAPVAERFRADMLVLGGNISRAYPLFGPAMERRLEADGHRIRIGLPARPDHAALIGAASLFI